jgi:hypothetical protein
VVNVSDAAIKQHCALGKVYDYAHFGDRISRALVPFNLHFRHPVTGQRDDCRFLRWTDERPIIVSSVHSTVSIRVMTPASQ